MDVCPRARGRVHHTESPLWVQGAGRAAACSRSAVLLQPLAPAQLGGLVLQLFPTQMAPCC